MRLWMHEQLLARFPGLGSIDVDYFWQGWVAIARDKGPHIGLADDGTIAYSLGYAGTGVAMSTHCGKLLADALRAARPSTLPPWWARPFLRSKSRRYASSINARHTATSTSRTNTCEQGKHAHGHPDHPSAQPPTAWRASAPSACRCRNRPAFSSPRHARSRESACSDRPVGMLARQIPARDRRGRSHAHPDGSLHAHAGLRPHDRTAGWRYRLLPPDTRGIWEILRTVRKVYVLF